MYRYIVPHHHHYYNIFKQQFCSVDWMTTHKYIHLGLTWSEGDFFFNDARLFITFFTGVCQRKYLGCSFSVTSGQFHAFQNNYYSIFCFLLRHQKKTVFASIFFHFKPRQTQQNYSFHFSLFQPICFVILRNLILCCIL